MNEDVDPRPSHPINPLVAAALTATFFVQCIVLVVLIVHSININSLEEEAVKIIVERFNSVYTAPKEVADE